MAETIKHAVARCQGEIFLLLHPGYGGGDAPMRIKVTKSEARRQIDKMPKGERPYAVWEDRNIVLTPRVAIPKV